MTGISASIGNSQSISAKVSSGKGITLSSTTQDIAVTLTQGTPIDVAIGASQEIIIEVSESIRGLAGSHGTSGTSGTSATSVTSGTSGSNGAVGSGGSSGSSGSSGTSGLDGTFYGSSGASGSHGTSGTSGSSGTGYPVRGVQVVVVDPEANVSTGNGKAYFVIPDELTGMDLTRVAATVITAGTTGSCGIGLVNMGTAGTATNEMLSTKMQIETTERTTRTSATPGIIDTSKDGVVTGDLIRVDVPNTMSTMPKGLVVEMAFSLP